MLSLSVSGVRSANSVMRRYLWVSRTHDEALDGERVQSLLLRSSSLVRRFRPPVIANYRYPCNINGSVTVRLQ